MDINVISPKGDIIETRTYENKFTAVYNLTSCLMEVMGRVNGILDPAERAKVSKGRIQVSGHHAFFNHNGNVYIVRVF